MSFADCLFQWGVPHHWQPRRRSPAVDDDPSVAFLRPAAQAGADPQPIGAQLARSRNRWLLALFPAAAHVDVSALEVLTEQRPLDLLGGRDDCRLLGSLPEAGPGMVVLDERLCRSRRLVLTESHGGVVRFDREELVERTGPVVGRFALLGGVA